MTYTNTYQPRAEAKIAIWSNRGCFYTHLATQYELFYNQNNMELSSTILLDRHINFWSFLDKQMRAIIGVVLNAKNWQAKLELHCKWLSTFRLLGLGVINLRTLYFFFGSISFSCETAVVLVYYPWGLNIQRLLLFCNYF